MSDNIQNSTVGQTPPCLRQKIDKTTYLIEVHFNERSTQSVEDRLRRVILHDLGQCKQSLHGKQGKMGNDEYALDKGNRRSERSGKSSLLDYDPSMSFDKSLYPK